MTAFRISIQALDFDIAAEVARLKALPGEIGAVVTFSGVCRDDGGKLAALELEHYPAMAEDEIARIANEAAGRWPLSGVTVIHRYGRMAPGDNIVLVATASTHRHAAFEAASFVMDFMKNKAPFWKKEHRRGAEASWVESRTADATAEARWERDG